MAEAHTMKRKDDCDDAVSYMRSLPAALFLCTMYGGDCLHSNLIPLLYTGVPQLCVCDGLRPFIPAVTLQPLICGVDYTTTAIPTYLCVLLRMGTTQPQPYLRTCVCCSGWGLPYIRIYTHCPHTHSHTHSHTR